MNTSQTSPLISRAAAIVLFICFFFPWLTVSCSGMEITATGYELATGIEEANSMGSSSSGTEEQNGEVKYFLIPVLAIVVLGVSFTSMSTARIAYFAAGVVGLGFMILEMIGYQNDISESRTQGVVVGFSYEMGWWLAMLSLAAFLVAGVIAGNDMSEAARAEYEAAKRKNESST
jgi:hypothetical protein